MDYDDFSGSTLDTTKWEVGYFAGGETVTIVNGQAKLSGSAYSPSSPSQMPSDFANAGQDATEGNTFLFIKDPSIIGLEADIMIPNAGNQNEAGVYLTTLDSNPFGSLGFELRKTPTGSSFNYSYFDDQGSKIYGYEAGSLDTFFKIKIIELNGQISYYLDNKLIKQVATTSHDTDYWGIGSFNDYGLAYTTYADNVRVLRNWEDYDDFSDNSLDTSKWTSTSSYFVGNQPTEANGRIELSGLTSQYSNTFLLFQDSEGIDGVEADIWLPSDAPVDTGVLIGIADAGTPVGYLDLWADSAQTHFSIGLDNSSTGESIDLTRNAELGKMYKVAIIKGEQKTALYLDGEKVAEVSTWQSDDLDIIFRGVNDAGSSFTAYLDNVRVIRRSTTTTQPDPVTVVFDPNGQAVVVQVGNEYQWNSTLDGVTLWGVEQSGDGWSSMTMRFENGRNFGNEGFFDSIAQPQPYDVPYEIDENGYIKSLEDDGDYQYYNAVSVENGVIGTIQNDEGVDSVANNGINQVDQWFFTTRAAAEEYYYSKVNPKDWMWFDNYPWVYSNEMQEWLYFYPSGSKLLYYSNKSKAWREFN